MLLDQGFHLEADQLGQAHLQDRVRLHLGEAELRGQPAGFLRLEFDVVGDAPDEAVPHLLLAAAAAQDLDDQVDDVHRPDQALLHLALFPLPLQQGAVLARRHLELEIDVMLQHGAEA